jgi:predicted nucleic acid-binding protein
VWVDHPRAADKTLVALLGTGTVLVHPFVTGELALGNLRQRDLVLGALQDLPQASVATGQEVPRFIGLHRLFGLGIGYVDAPLLAAVRLAQDGLLWTRDQRRHSVAQQLGLAASGLH